MPFKLCWISLFFTVLLVSCRNNETENRQGSNPVTIGKPLEIKYSTRFSVTMYSSYKELKVISPWPGSMDTFTYRLYHKKIENPSQTTGSIPVALQLPVSSMVCFSTTHLPYLEMLDEQDKLTGFPTTSYISSATFRERVLDGKIRDLGPSNEINIEQIMELDPDLVIAFSMNNDLSMIEKIKRSGIPVILNADYLEDHPLGRAEWIKFIAAFFDKEKMADSIFSEIEKSYLETRAKVTQVKYKPSVLTGVVYGDTWFMPGGRHYGSIFFEDSGAAYLWSDNSSGEILQLSFESVYEKAQNADYWVGVATYGSLKDIEQADERYTAIKAFQEGNVYNYTAKAGPAGGNAYFEEGYARPDIILNDLAKIFHPELMNEHLFYFYKKLN